MNVKKLMLTTATLSLGLVATTITPQVINTTVYASENGWQGKNFIKADGTQAKSEWIQDNGSWFYIKDNGEYASDEWVGNYYFKHWGYMAQNEWIESNGNWYYLKADGQYAWQEWIGNYYFNYWGDMAHNSWVESNGNWYYMNQNGVMQTGWQEINGNWYYMNGSGAMATNQWVGDYYMGSNGIMLENTITPDGYLVGYDGKWVKGEQIVFPISESPTNQQNQQTSQQEPVENNHDNKPVKSLEEMEEYLNNNIDQQHINDEFIKLLNEEREAHGITTVTYSPILFKGADIRSEELEISFSHTRPNGEPSFTSIPKIERNKFRGTWENGGAPGVYITADKSLIDFEQDLANEFFDGWKNSPKHYDNMMKNGDLQAGISVHFVVTKFNSNKYLVKCYSSLLIGGDAYN